MPALPAADDLLDAVERFLRDIEPKLAGRAAFHAKVAGNVLAIVARELRQRPEAAERAALGDVAELCARIRAGDAGVDTPGLLDALVETTVARLAVDNPRYSTLARLRGIAT